MGEGDPTLRVYRCRGCRGHEITIPAYQTTCETTTEWCEDCRDWTTYDFVGEQ